MDVRITVPIPSYRIENQVLRSFHQGSAMSTAIAGAQYM